MKKLSAVIFIAAFILWGAGLSYCEGDNRELKTFHGNVTEIDWVGSLLTVEGVDEITFFVPSDVKIKKGAEDTSLSDIELNDSVLIKYYDDPSGTPKAIRITDENTYPSF